MFLSSLTTSSTFSRLLTTNGNSLKADIDLVFFNIIMRAGEDGVY